MLTADNRAFRYGDGIFETFCVRNNQPLFFNDHWNRMVHSLNKLSIPAPADFESQHLKDNIQLLLAKNSHLSGRVRLVIYREAAGLYSPVNSKSSWHLSITGAITATYQTSEKGLSADVFEDDHKSCGALSNLKTLSALIYVCAGIAAQKNGWNDCLIKNEKGNIIESSNSNLFLRKGTSFITPPLSEGCLDGIMRMQVIALLKKNQIHLTEKPVQLTDILEAEEVLLTNVVNGVTWIEKFRGKEYKNVYATTLNGWLNKII